MAMTKSRKATAQITPAEVVAKAVCQDIDQFFDAESSAFRVRFAETKAIFRKGEAERPVMYSQEQHSALATHLSHLSALAKLLTQSLAKAHLRIEQLESGQNTSKAAPLPYAGAWKQGQEYVPGQFLTFGGSVWHVDKKTRSRPGDDPDAYTLAVKSGRDGKDARP